LPLIDLTSPHRITADEDAPAKMTGAWGSCPIFHGRLETWCSRFTMAGLVVGLLVRAASPPPQYPVHPRHS
jgi:hypothetical protein